MLRHYDDYDESQRLFQGLGQLELARTKTILEQRLPPAPAVIVDVGGGPGVYSLWLASLGYETHLVEIIPTHVEKARAASGKQSGRPISSFHVADAVELPQADEMADAVLLMGPLYHLTERSDRLRALAEARRILRPGGLLFAAAISRFASLMDGLARGLVDDDEFMPILERDLREGQHRNPTGNLEYFTTAYFHRPDGVTTELLEAGFENVEVLGVEGPAWIASNFADRWASPRRRDWLLHLASQVEREPSLLGMSPHLLAVGTKR